MSEDVLSTLPADARVQVDGYLDAVERALADAGVDRSRRRAITDDIELHLRDVLASTPQPHDAAAIGGVLAKLDAPQTYALAATQSNPPPPLPRAAIAEPVLDPRPGKTGALWLLVSIACFVLVFFGYFALATTRQPVVVQAVAANTPPPPPVQINRAPAVLPIVAAFAMLAATPVTAVLATVRGWGSLLAIGRGERPRWQTVQSFAAAVFWPTVIAWLAALLVCYLLACAYYDGPFIPNRGRAIEMLGTVILGVLFTGPVIFLAVRCVRGRRTPAISPRLVPVL